MCFCASFGYSKHNQIFLEFAWQHFGTQHLFLIKVNIDIIVRLDKINVHKVYNLHFFDNHKASCLWFMKHYQIKENNNNNAKPTYKISSFFIW